LSSVAMVAKITGTEAVTKKSETAESRVLKIN